MYITNNSQNSFKASFSQDPTTQKILKQGIETNPYDVYEVSVFLNRLNSNDIFSLSSKNTKDGEKIFIQRNNEKAIEINTNIITNKSPIINALKQLSYTIAQGGEQFKTIFGAKTEPIGDFSFHANNVIEKFLNGADVSEFYDEINKLEKNNSQLKMVKKTSRWYNFALGTIEDNNRKILKLRELSSNLDKDFVRKALKIK